MYGGMDRKEGRGGAGGILKWRIAAFQLFFATSFWLHVGVVPEAHRQLHVQMEHLIHPVVLFPYCNACRALLGCSAMRLR